MAAVLPHVAKDAPVPVLQIAKAIPPVQVEVPAVAIAVLIAVTLPLLQVAALAQQDVHRCAQVVVQRHAKVANTPVKVFAKRHAPVVAKRFAQVPINIICK